MDGAWPSCTPVGTSALRTSAGRVAQAQQAGTQPGGRGPAPAGLTPRDVGCGACHACARGGDPLSGPASGRVCAPAWLLRGPGSQWLELGRGPSACPRDGRRQGGLLVTFPPPGWTARSDPSTWANQSSLPRHDRQAVRCLGSRKHTQACVLSAGRSLWGQAWSSGLACVLHPGPSPGTLPLSLVQHGTRAQPGPGPRPHPQAPAGTCLCRQRPARSSRRSSSWGRWPRRHLRWHTVKLAEPAVGEGTLGAPNTAVTQRPPSPAQAEGPGKGGSLGTDGPLGGVLLTPSRPVVKAPAISRPCHWPGHSAARGPRPSPHRACACVPRPASVGPRVPEVE